MRIVFAQHGQRAAAVERSELIALRADVIERHDDKRNISLDQRHFLSNDATEFELPLLIQHGALRPARCAARIDQIDEIVIAGIRRQRPVAGCQFS